MQGVYYFYVFLFYANIIFRSVERFNRIYLFLSLFPRFLRVFGMKYTVLEKKMRGIEKFFVENTQQKKKWECFDHPQDVDWNDEPEWVKNLYREEKIESTEGPTQQLSDGESDNGESVKLESVSEKGEKRCGNCGEVGHNIRTCLSKCGECGAATINGACELCD